MLTWGLLIGLGTGSMAMVFAATVANRWFYARRGLVTGILTAAAAAGQLAFLPVMANLVESSSWRAASLAVSLAAIAVVPFVILVLRDYPADRGVRAYGAPADQPDPVRPDPSGAARRAIIAPAQRRPHPDLLGPGRRLRHLRRDHQRPGRHPLHPVRA